MNFQSYWFDMPKTPIDIYTQHLNEGEIRPDPAQRRAAEALDGLYKQIILYEIGRVDLPKSGFSEGFDYLKSKFKGKKNLKNIPKGLYIHGGVGRGKSMLMNLFFATLPDGLLKRRVHFHEFMIEVHNYLHERRSSKDGGDGVDGALPALARDIAQSTRILCFDEFHVTDVADAMILGRLFTALFDYGVVVVATSNWPPEKLYEGGLQRDRFVPFIDLLKTRMEVIHLDSPTDYRTEFEGTGETYFHPMNDLTQKRADELFRALSGDTKPQQNTLKVKGRKIEVSQEAEGVARFTFQQLCEQPYGAEDYLKIAQSYHTVFLENVRKMGYDRRNEAKRLMTLIDALYENHTKLIVTAETTPERLYVGHDHAFEFDRTISRLMEMQSAEYLAETPS